MTSMWKYFFILLLSGLISCARHTGNNETDASDNTGSKLTDVSSVRDIYGKWMIENIVENDSSYIRPIETEPPTTAYFTFDTEDSFGIMTNCNHLNGKYLLHGDSMRLEDISYTELACDNMRMENLLKKILPSVSYLDAINDTVLRLNCEIESSYIVLRKITTDIK